MVSQLLHQIYSNTKNINILKNIYLDNKYFFEKIQLIFLFKLVDRYNKAILKNFTIKIFWIIFRNFILFRNNFPFLLESN